jgi:hypothetical protein
MLTTFPTRRPIGYDILTRSDQRAQNGRGSATAWLALLISGYAAGARLLAATLCAEHVCDVSDHGEDWLPVPSSRHATEPSTRQCHDCGQVFAPIVE